MNKFSFNSASIHNYWCPIAAMVVFRAYSDVSQRYVTTNIRNCGHFK